MSALQLDPTGSKLTLRTRATGMLAALAHDLEISATELRGAARLEGDSWSGELEIPVAGLRVAGTLRGDTLDPSGVSDRDRREIEQRIRDEVLRGTDVVRVAASGATRDRGEARVTLVSGSAALQVTLSARDRDAGAVGVTGRCQLSMASLGVREVKGPLGAFKLKDALEVLFDLTLRPAR